MPIQDEAPFPVNPLATLASDYEHAVLHLAWNRNKETGERTFLFGWVEFLPVEVPPPIDDGDLGERLGSKSDHYVYVRHAVVSAERALRWYLGCRRGTAVLPEEDGQLREDDDAEARNLRLGDLGEEPPWPSLVCVEDREVVAPFCPTWHACPRVHHLVPLVPLDPKRLWSKEQEREKAIRFLSDRLHFELAEYPEYWGSVHLVAPNPVFRDLEVRRQPTSTADRESILLRFRPRAGKDLQGLSVAVREDRPSGLGALCHLPVQRPIVRLTFERATNLHSEMVSDRERGVLFASGKGVFLSGSNLNVAVGPERTRVVQASGAAPYEVPLQMPASQQISIRQGNRVPQGRSLLWSAVQNRRKRVRGGEQRWFNGTKEEAEIALREILHGAAREVLIVDPYFGAAELHNFALAVGKVDVPIFVLTSAELLRSEPAPRKGDALLAQLKHVASLPFMNAIAVRVMPGKRPVIHDRFFVVDDRVWLLGSSLNEFGSRGTMMVVLPDPGPVREKLFEAWYEAEELESWLKAREERQKDDAPGEPR